MEVPYFGNNPFAALSILVAPAILTSASSVLCLGTANRLARVVDRTRIVSTQRVSLASDADYRHVSTVTWKNSEFAGA